MKFIEGTLDGARDQGRTRTECTSGRTRASRDNAVTLS